jgi:serine phosphatase RsbU (regulator of sigma subunit)
MSLTRKSTKNSGLQTLLLSIAERFRPELQAAGGIEQVAGVADVLGFLYAIPLALLGWTWLAFVTNLSLVRAELPMLALLLALIFLFERLGFFVYLDLRGLIVSAEGSLSSVAIWSGTLLFGPTALWLAVVAPFVELLPSWHQAPSTADRWGTLRHLALRQAGMIPTTLLALYIYERWGGKFPLAALAPQTISPALYAILLQSVLGILIYLPFLLYVSSRAGQFTETPTSIWTILRVAAVGLVLPGLAAPFAILAVGLYAQNGLAVYLFFIGGLLLGSFLAHQLSQAVERSQQRSRELEKLEQMGQALIGAPPDASMLPELLKRYVPDMFPASRIEIRRFPDETLVRFPDTEDWAPVPESAWEWVRSARQAHPFVPNAHLPWHDKPLRQPLVVAPVMDTEAAEPLGGIYIAPQRNAVDIESLLPAVQSLAAQISSALQSAQVYAQALEIQKVEQELALAGRIQTRFLPEVLPEIPGWQLAVSLEPARRTSGDFYDVIPLPNGRLGIVVADVADKGMGAALYMALSRTLIRTYAYEHHTRPDFALRVANNRILSDTQVDLFVTTFYAVLDPLTGKLSYCNAGHNPPFLLKAGDTHEVQKLTRTGLPLGLFRGHTWEQRTAQLAPGDVLLLYTDGITEAQDESEHFFGEERLLALVLAHRNHSAHDIREAILDGVHAFVGEAAQFDDMALLVIVREE